MASLGQGGRWRVDTLMAEAVANLWSRRGRSSVLAAVVALVVAGLFVADAAAADEVIRAKKELVAAGGLVVVVTREDGATLPATRCSLLAQQPHVMAAGGVRKGKIVYFGHAPGTPFQAIEVTDGLLGIISLGRTAVADGVVLADAAAHELGVVSGSWVTLDGGPTPVGGVVDPQKRAEAFSRTVFMRAPPTGGVDQCWIEFRDGAFDQGVNALPAWFDGQGQLALRPLIDRNISSRDLARDWSNRSTRQAWMVGAVLLCAFVLILVWRRRAEFTLYLLLGSSRAGIAFLQTVENYLLILGGGALGLAWGVWLALTSGVSDASALGQGFRAALLCLLLTLVTLPVSFLWLLRADLAAILKERPG